MDIRVQFVYDSALKKIAAKCYHNTILGSEDGIPIELFNCKSNSNSICDGCKEFFIWANQQRDNILTTLFVEGNLCVDCFNSKICNCVIRKYKRYVRKIAKPNCLDIQNFMKKLPNV